jgi:serpin B
MGNSLWGEDMKPAYIELCAKRMAAEVRPLAGCSVINAWVAERTKGMISRLLASDPPGPVVLVNVLAVKAMWTQSFDLSKTRVAKFYRGEDEDGDPSDAVECDMMTGTEEFEYTCLCTEHDDAQVVELPYGPRTDGNPFVAYVLLPGLLGSVEKMLETVVRNAGVFDDIVDSMETHKVRLELPKFTLESNTSVKDDLVSLGMDSAFGASAAFDRLTDADVFVKDVVHAVKIVVDEAGTEAAAATAAVFATKGGGGRKKDYIDMCVNRKFVFLLRCRVTKALLFAAVVTNPRPLTE